MKKEKTGHSKTQVGWQRAINPLTAMSAWRDEANNKNIGITLIIQ